MTDSLTSLSLGHMTYFDCTFLTSLAMYLISLPEGELGIIFGSLEFPRSIWKEEENKDGPERGRQRKMKEFGGGKYSLLE